MVDSLFTELKRRNVFKVGVAYLVLIWVIVQVTSEAVPALHLPDWVNTLVFFLGIIGFPFAIFFAWAFEITPEGVVRENNINHEESITHHTARTLDFIIIGLLVVALGYFIYESRFDTESKRLSSDVAESSSTKKPKDINAVLPSIAVLAFEDFSPGSDQEYFADGIADEILNLLVKTHSMIVTGRTSSFSFKNKDVDIPTIAKTLNVGHVLEGSINKSGNKLKITVQLNNADGYHLWSETYKRELKDIFEIQEEIAKSIVSNLTVKLNVQQSGVLITSQTKNMQAYTLYLKAKHLLLQHNSESNHKAEKVIRQSISFDPEYAPTWALLSKVVLEATTNFLAKDTQKGYQESKSAAQKSIALDKYYAPAYAVLARINIVEMNFEEAARNIQTALKLDSGNAYILSSAAYTASFFDRDEEVKLMQQAIQLDPLEYRYSLSLALTLTTLNRLDEALLLEQQVLLFQPNMAIVHTAISFILLEQGKTNQALLEAEKEPNEFWRMYSKIVILYILERFEESDILFKQLIARFGKSDPENIADIYAYRGDKNNTFKWLNIAADKSYSGLLFTLRFRHYQDFYQDSRWDALLKKINLPKNHWLWKKTINSK